MSRRVNAVAVAALVGSAIVLLVLVIQGGSKPHTLRAGFDNAIQLTTGQQVRVAGRQVGRLGDIELVDGQASVEVVITDDEVWPLPKGTIARARYGSTTSYLTRYVELYPGPVDAGELEEGAILTADANLSAEELDESYRIFRGGTDGQTSALVDSLGEGLEGQGDDLRRGLASAPRGLDAAADFVGEVAADEERLRTLAVAGDETTTALASQSDDLRALIANAASTIDEFAAHTTAQQLALDRAPETFAVTTATLARLDVSLDNLDGLVADIAPGAPALRELAGTARSTLDRLRTVSPLLSSTLERGTVATPRLRRLFDTAAGFFPRARSALDTFVPQFDCIRPYAPEIAGFLSTWTGQLQNYDNVGHYARSFPLTAIPALLPGTSNNSPTALALQAGELSYAMPRPPGLNAGKPWLRPKCGSGPDALDATKDPEAAR